MSEFNPSDPKYKKVEDLPKEEQARFADVDGGFVKKEAADSFAESGKQASEVNLRYDANLDAKDILHNELINEEEAEHRRVEAEKAEQERLEKEMKLGLGIAHSVEDSGQFAIEKIRDEFFAGKESYHVDYQMERFLKDNDFVVNLVESYGKWWDKEKQERYKLDAENLEKAKSRDMLEFTRAILEERYYFLSHMRRDPKIHFTINSEEPAFLAEVINRVPILAKRYFEPTSEDKDYITPHYRKDDKRLETARELLKLNDKNFVLLSDYIKQGIFPIPEGLEDAVLKK